MKTVKKRGWTMKTVLAGLVLALALLGGSLSDHSFAQEEIELEELLEVRLGFTNPDAKYLLNPAPPDGDPIDAVITFENISGRELLATQGYAGNLHLLLRITDPKGLQITAQHLLPSTYQRTMTVILEVDNFVEADPVEVVPWGGQEADRSFSVPFNLRDFYNFRIPGRHTAQLFVPVGLYETSSLIEGTDFARFKERIAEGDGISNAVTFTLIDDADGDGWCFPVQHPLLCANPEPDCEDRPAGADGVLGTVDDGANLNPGQAEIPNNGLDDDCNTATPDAQLVEYGTIDVRAVKHTVGLGSHPGSTKEPICLHLRLFDKSAGSCVVSHFGVSHHHYEDIWNSCLSVVQGNAFTDEEGTASLNVAPGDYVLIGQYDPDRPTCPGAPTIDGNEIYLGVSASDLQLNQTMRKHLQYIVKANGKKVPAKYTKKDGSELLIIEPEYVEWDGAEELYPFVFDSIGDWTVTTSVSPPEGFVADNHNLSEDVFTEVEAVQFIITDVGSKWEATEVTYELKHKKKKEKHKSKIDVKLSKELAKKKGVTVWGKPLKKKE